MPSSSPRRTAVLGGISAFAIISLVVAILPTQAAAAYTRPRPRPTTTTSAAPTPTTSSATATATKTSTSPLPTTSSAVPTSSMPAPTSSTPAPTSFTPAPSTTTAKPSPTPTSTAPGAPDCAGEYPVKVDGTPWVCTFDDEFSGSTLDPTKWSPIVSSASGANGGGACFVNTPNNISQADGYLTLTVRQEAAAFVCKTPSGGFTTTYSSGEVATYTKFSQTYGRFEVRASFPAATVAGLQSALWLWPDNPLKYGAWPTSGEIDIAEEYSLLADRAVPYVHYLYNPYTVSTLTHTNVVTNNYCMISDVHAFHDYVVEWTPTTMTILYDGNTCLIDNYSAYAPLTGSQPFDQPFFVALTQSLGSSTNAVTAATPLPASTQVDYVRVWK
jgi:beta-glucanase (GH16 family)